MPFFSIIIPVYNVAPYLRECLDSVLAQIFTDWEAICIDDGSTDGSGAILDEYAAKDSRFRVFHQSNAGVSVARNKGLDIANGKWIWFVDGDDALRSCSLRDIFSAIHNQPNIRSVRLDYVYGETVPTIWPVGELSPTVFPVACDEGLRRFFFGIASMVLSREAIDSLRLEEFPRGEDTVFLLACAKRGFGCVDLHKTLYFYRQRQGSATHILQTIDIVEKNFECQRRQVENFAESIRSLGDIPAPSCWAWLFTICYNTYYNMYFKLSAKERGALVGKWIALMDSFNGHYKPPFSKRVRIGLIKVIRSGALVGYLAHGHIPGLSKVIALVRKCRIK